ACHPRRQRVAVRYALQPRTGGRDDAGTRQAADDHRRATQPESEDRLHLQAAPDGKAAGGPRAEPGPPDDRARADRYAESPRRQLTSALRFAGRQAGQEKTGRASGFFLSSTIHGLSYGTLDRACRPRAPDQPRACSQVPRHVPASWGNRIEPAGRPVSAAVVRLRQERLRRRWCRPGARLESLSEPEPGLERPRMYWQRVDRLSPGRWRVRVSA